MAEEGTLGLARVADSSTEDLSKEHLQRRMDEARESISHTVTEIKDSVVHQYEAVKDTISETLDWREQFKKRPVAWTVGAASAGFLTGYCMTSMIKGDDRDGYAEGYERGRHDFQQARQRYAPPPAAAGFVAQAETADTHEGPGLLSRIQDTPAYERVKSEATNLGGRLVDEVSKSAQDILLPAAIGWVRHWLEGLIPEKPASTRSQPLNVYPRTSPASETANTGQYEQRS
jgi:hypothetical protein